PCRSTRPGCEWGWRFSHRGGAPTADPDLLVSSVLAGAHAPGANGAGGFCTEAVLLQQIPISSLALSLQEHPPPGANGCGGSHRGGAPTADPDLLVSSVLAGAPAPGCEWG